MFFPIVWQLNKTNSLLPPFLLQLLLLRDYPTANTIATCIAGAAAIAAGFKIRLIFLCLHTHTNAFTFRHYNVVFVRKILLLMSFIFLLLFVKFYINYVGLTIKMKICHVQNVCAVHFVAIL